MINPDAIESLLKQKTYAREYAAMHDCYLPTSATHLANALNELKRDYCFEFVAAIGSILVFLDTLPHGSYRTPEGVRREPSD